MSSRYGELQPINGWDRFGSLRHPQQISTGNVLPFLLQRHRSPEANQTLHDVWPSPGLVHYVYTFGGSCPWRNFVPYAKFTLRPSLAFSYINNCVFCCIYCCYHLWWIKAYQQRYCTALQQRSSAKLCGAVQCTRNGITELSQRAPPIFGRAAITLGIGPSVFSLDRHCSIDFGFAFFGNSFRFLFHQFLVS